MTRRRLVITSDSDDSDDDYYNEEQRNQQQQQQGSEFHLLNPNPHPNLPDQPEPLPISSDEFIDVSDHLTPPSPSPENHYSPPVISDSPTGDLLLRMGLSLKREWLDSCLRQIDSSLDVASKAKFCFQQVLNADMNCIGAGVLPPNVDSMHLVDLSGPFVLQVDEIVNISTPLKGRYQDMNSGLKRCLKLSMTDGVQRIFGMEYRPIKDLKVLAPAGFKVAICNVHIRHGLVMLVPEALEILGGVVEELEAARQRLVDEINKPPRGRRSRTGDVPPLATRATLAAWPQNGVNIVGGTNSSANVPGHNNSSVNHLQNSTGSVNVVGRTNSSVNVVRPTSRLSLQGATPFHADGSGANFVASCADTIQRTLEECSVPMSADAPVTNTMQRIAEESAVAMSAENNMPHTSSIVSDVEDMHISAPTSEASALSNEHSNTTLEQEDVHMVDQFEHPLILSRDQEMPFTYLANLSAKWAAVKEKEPSVRGKSKCFLTGVKGFQYKKRMTYELQVYVDDGSLISEIFIDHNVVLKGIGHSPEEVTAALSSSDTKTVGEMKETLRQFQIFLVNFEGTMLVEINGASTLPVALEMDQGCPSSDAWLLMRRLKSFSVAQTPQRSTLDPIDTSP